MKKLKCKCCNVFKPKSEYQHKHVFNTSTQEVRPTLNSRTCNTCRNKDSTIRERLKRHHPKPNHTICECCKTDISKIGTGILVFDHDKVLEKFRGWICESCNTGIGKLGDNIEGIENAIQYLQNYLKKTKKTINYKPSKIMNTSKLDLIKYFVDNGEYEYASKTLSEISEVETTPVEPTSEKLDTSKLPANKRAAARKKYCEDHLKPYNPELQLPTLTETQEIVQAYSFFNRSDKNVQDFIDSGSLYENPSGTADFCHDLPVYTKHINSLN